MSDEKKPPVYDMDGYDVISKALQAILNNFPGLEEEDEKIGFADLQKDSGIAFYPVSGAYVESVNGGTYEDGDITGHVDATCQYPFYVVYRAAPRTGNQKITIKEWLEQLGRWLDELAEYPELTEEGYSIRSISRQTPAYVNTVSEDGVEDWQISILLRYRHEFDR